MVNNDFYKKYQPIDWKSDGKAILNKIGNNLTSRFNQVNSEVIDDNDGLRIELTQKGSYCVLWWVFNDANLDARLEDPNGNPISNMSEVEAYIDTCGFLRDTDRVKKFESFVESLADKPKEEKCKCGKFSKDKCECGPNCECDNCKKLTK